MAIKEHTNWEWMVPEYNHHQKTGKWYIWMGLVTVGLLIFSLFTSNFLFAIIIIISCLIIVFRGGKESNSIRFAIGDEGVFFGQDFFDFNEIDSFAVLCKPSQNISNLYLSFKNSFKPKLIVPVPEEDILTIREILLKYFKEDLEKEHLSGSEIFGRFLKL